MISDNKTLVLTKKDVIETLNQVGLDHIMDELILRIEQAIIDYNVQNTNIPTRSGFHYDVPHTGLVEWMPVYQNGKEVVIKIVGYHPKNPSIYNLPTIVSTISKYDTSSGHMVSLMDGVLLTALRTGAASAVATRAFAHPDSKTLGLIGCGAQAVTQLHAISRVFDIEDVLIYDVDSTTQSNFKDRVEVLELDCSIHETDMKYIVESSDIITTSTSIDVGAGPLFSGVDTLSHLHINAVGSDFPGKTELPLPLLQSSRVIPDFRSQAIIEGECQQMEESEIYNDWIEILKHKNRFQQLKTERTVFDSTGWALEDLVVSKLFTEYAIKLGLGQYMEIENLSNDVKNPYASISNNKAVDLEEILAKIS